MYYAVRKGRITGIFNTWDEAKAQVFGFKGAVYKKFKTKQEAQAFIDDMVENQESKESEILKDNELIAYVDGSYNIKDKTFSYGAVLFNNNDIYEEHSKRFYNEDSTMRNVSGEIKGAAFAMKRAIELNKNKLYLHYDYAGIEHWAKLTWKANKPGTINYRDYYISIKDKLEVVFIKVKAHSGIKYNEIVDKLAKDAK